METTSETPSSSEISSDLRTTELRVSRARKKEYVQRLEQAIHILTTEKMELQAQVVTINNQLHQQSLQIDELIKLLHHSQSIRNVNSSDNIYTILTQ